ncbi:MAG: hypothetical protein WBA57_20195 [Elainellaceae cyanobacterium]
MSDSMMRHRNSRFSFWSPAGCFAIASLSAQHPWNLSPCRLWRSDRARALAIALAGSALGWLWMAPAQAEMQPPETAPAAVTEMLMQIDAAASDRNVEEVMEFFSPEFSHADGLTYDDYEAALEAFWERYATVNYATTLTAWEQDGEDTVIKTVTAITGSESIGDRSAQLSAEVASRQVIRGGQLLEQEILTEDNTLTLGPTPPTLDVNLPQQVAVGQQFSFDAIVLEPLGDRILLGTALEEAVSPEIYTTPSTIDFELLAAGGLFKIGQAPVSLDDQWISAVVVREDGLTAVTRRLEIVNRLDD